MALSLAEHYSSLSPASLLQRAAAWRDEDPLTDVLLMSDNPRTFAVPPGIEVGVRLLEYKACSLLFPSSYSTASRVSAAVLLRRRRSKDRVCPRNHDACVQVQARGHRCRGLPGHRRLVDRFSDGQEGDRDQSLPAGYDGRRSSRLRLLGKTASL